MKTIPPYEKEAFNYLQKWLMPFIIRPSVYGSPVKNSFFVICISIILLVACESEIAVEPVRNPTRVLTATKSIHIEQPHEPIITATIVATPPEADLVSNSYLIAFSRKRMNEEFDVYTMLSDGSAMQNITNHPGNDIMPVWSPDGESLLFVSDRDGNYNIYMMAADGSNLVQLTDDPAADGLPTWSPLGDQIAFSTEREGHAMIYTMTNEGRQQTRLTRNNLQHEMSPAWSPTSARIAFVAHTDDVKDPVHIYIINTDGTNEQMITEGFERIVAVSWSPDGSKLAYSGQRGGSFDVYILNMNTNETIQLPSYSRHDILPVWSPTGQALAFVSPYTNGTLEIHTMNVDGTNIRQLTDDVYTTSSYPDWQPLSNP